MTADYCTPEEVIRFWFADASDDPGAANARNAVWYGASPEFDEAVRERFESTIAAAARGELAAWKETPRSSVALVIVLDQFPRNVYRNRARAFEYDGRALDVTRHALGAGHLNALSIPGRVFLLMPYQHVEDEAAQREGLALFERLAAEAPSEWHAFTASTLDFARRHLELIERYGRFPHRNAALGRQSTPAEREYLETKPETFGQGGG
jgi:uncharacterized protein (DUF924 family)